MGLDQRVLIVEDSVPWVTRLAHMVTNIPGLTYLGSTAIAREAVELIFRHQPDIVVLDLSLAQGTGVDVLKAVGARLPSTSIMVVTGEPSEILKTACMQFGASHFFDKALEIDLLHKSLQDLADRETM